MDKIRLLILTIRSLNSHSIRSRGLVEADTIVGDRNIHLIIASTIKTYSITKKIGIELSMDLEQG